MIISLIIIIIIVILASSHGEKVNRENGTYYYPYPNSRAYHEQPCYPTEPGRVNCVFPTQQEILLGKERLAQIEAELEAMKKSKEESDPNAETVEWITSNSEYILSLLESEDMEVIIPAEKVANLNIELLTAFLLKQDGVEIADTIEDGSIYIKKL